jgi:hypothetical protein
MDNFNSNNYIDLSMIDSLKYLSDLIIKINNNVASVNTALEVENEKIVKLNEDYVKNDEPEKVIAFRYDKLKIIEPKTVLTDETFMVFNYLKWRITERGSNMLLMADQAQPLICVALDSFSRVIDLYQYIGYQFFVDMDKDLLHICDSKIIDIKKEIDDKLESVDINSAIYYDDSINSDISACNAFIETKIVILDDTCNSIISLVYDANIVLDKLSDVLKVNSIVSITLALTDAAIKISNIMGEGAYSTVETNEDSTNEVIVPSLSEYDHYLNEVHPDFIFYQYSNTTGNVKMGDTQYIFGGSDNSYEINKPDEIAPLMISKISSDLYDETLISNNIEITEQDVLDYAILKSLSEEETSSVLESFNNILIPIVKYHSENTYIKELNKLKNNKQQVELLDKLNIQYNQPEQIIQSETFELRFKEVDISTFKDDDAIDINIYYLQDIINSKLNNIQLSSLRENDDNLKIKYYHRVGEFTISRVTDDGINQLKKIKYSYYTAENLLNTFSTSLTIFDPIDTPLVYTLSNNTLTYDTRSFYNIEDYIVPDGFVREILDSNENKITNTIIYKDISNTFGADNQIYYEPIQMKGIFQSNYYDAINKLKIITITKYEYTSIEKINDIDNYVISEDINTHTIKMDYKQHNVVDTIATNVSYLYRKAIVEKKIDFMQGRTSAIITSIKHLGFRRVMENFIESSWNFIRFEFIGNEVEDNTGIPRVFSNTNNNQNLKLFID